MRCEIINNITKNLSKGLSNKEDVNKIESDKQHVKCWKSYQFCNSDSWL